MMSRDFILRLSKYNRILQKLKSLGFVKVFSNNLGDAIGVSPALVRKDFSLISLPGNKRGGYDIDTLIRELDRVLGRDQPQKVIIAGCGRIGTALMEYKEFTKEGIQIVAGFDIEPPEDRAPGQTPVYDVSDMENYIKENDIKLGIVAVPDTAAHQVLEWMINGGIKGVLNFAPVELKTSERCVIHNVNIGLEIENLLYFVTHMEKTGEVVSPA